MDKEKFAQAFANAKPLPVEDIVRTREIQNSKVRHAVKVHFPGTVDDVQIETDFGSSKVRIYTPEEPGPFPVILYMHGGGFCVGDPDLSDNACRIIARVATAVLVSVDYRLAPEHKFPTALEECYAIGTWLLDNDIALNIRADQLVIAGDSAGGNLAAALCLLARERKDFTPSYQALICPLLDQQTDHAKKIEPITEIILSTRNSRTFRGYYFRAEDDGSNPLLSPLLAADFSGLPPATIITAELDPLAAEALEYGERLKAAGVAVRQRHYDGLVHDFVMFVGPLDEAAEAAERIGWDIREFFSS